VGEHGALGRAGGARREEDVGGVIAVERRDPPLHLLRGDRAGAAEEVVPRPGARRHPATQHDGVLESVEPVDAVEEREIVGVEEVGDGEQHAGARGAQHVPRFAALEPGVQRHDHAAGGVRAQGGDGPLGHVRRPDGDAVAGAQTGGDEGPPGRVGRGRE
jgi:hypothetical protein